MINIQTSKGLDEAIITFQARRDQIVHSMRQPLQEAGNAVRDEAVRRISVGGDPAWPPSKKTLGTTLGPFGKMGMTLEIAGYGQTGIDTGTMMRSIHSEVVADDRVEIGVGHEAMPYAQYFQEGTGTYAGHAAWTVVPVRAKILSWVVQGARFFARSTFHEGQPPRPFLYIDGSLETRIRNIFLKWLNAPEEAG